MDSFVSILKARIEDDPDLSAAGLAKAAGLDNSTIRQMIARDRSPRIDTALKICRALGVTLEKFMAGGRDPVRAELHFLIDQLSNAEIDLLLNAARGLRAPRHD